MRLSPPRAVVALAVVLVSGSICTAGPSFNANRAELADLSRRAGAALHEGLAAVHAMLQYLEQLNAQGAAGSQAAALRSLEVALSEYKKIVELAPRQRLVIKPRTEQETRALDLLGQALSRRDIKFPTTERDLAELAIRFVTDFRDALSAQERFDEKTTRAYMYFEALFREEGDLLNVGLFCSVIWEMQDAARQASNKRLQPSAPGAIVRPRG